MYSRNQISKRIISKFRGENSFISCKFICLHIVICCLRNNGFRLDSNEAESIFLFWSLREVEDQVGDQRGIFGQLNFLVGETVEELEVPVFMLAVRLGEQEVLANAHVDIAVFAQGQAEGFKELHT